MLNTDARLALVVLSLSTALAACSSASIGDPAGTPPTGGSSGSSVSSGSSESPSNGSTKPDAGTTTTIDAGAASDSSTQPSDNDARTSSSTTPAPPSWDATESNLDAQGWTTFPPDPPNATLYVSASDPSASDSNSGLSQSAPIKTLSRASSLMKSSTTIQRVMLKKGDAWQSDPFTITIGYAASTSANPFLVGAYGTGARPVIAPAAQSNGINLNAPASHVAIVGLEVRTPANTDNDFLTPNGIQIFGQPYDDILLEDDFVQGFYDNVSVQTLASGAPAITNFKMRRCVLVDSHYKLNHADVNNDRSQGIYAASVTDALIEENIFDNNAGGPSNASEFAHSIYWQSGNFNATLRGNIVADAPDSVQLRSGGTATDNLFFNNAISLAIFCSVEPNGAQATQNCDGQVLNNVVLDGHDFGVDSMAEQGGTPARAWGITVGNGSTGPLTAKIANNIIAHSKTAAMLTPTTKTSFTAKALDIEKPVANATLSNNFVYDWGTGVLLSGVAKATFANNQFQIVTDAATTGATTLFSIDSKTGLSASGDKYYSPSADAFSIASSSMTGAAFASAIGETNASLTQIDYAASGLHPDRDLGDYAATVLGATSNTAAAFIARARQQSKDNWDSRFTADAANAYLRQSFGVTEEEE